LKNLKNKKNFTDLLILQFYGNIYKDNLGILDNFHPLHNILKFYDVRYFNHQNYPTYTPELRNAIGEKKEILTKLIPIICRLLHVFLTVNVKQHSYFLLRVYTDA
jgi:hypothetical protein